MLKEKISKDNYRPLLFFGGVAVLSYLIIILASLNINAPFNHATGDENGEYGVAAINLANNGAWKMKFGIDVGSFTTNPQPGEFYTHHPAGFIWPTVWAYKLFGVSEKTTRLGPLLWLLVGFWFFAFGLKNMFFPKIIPPLIILAIFSLLPGVIFYGETLELSIFSLPAALISWALLVAWAEREKKLYQAAFFVSLFIGGLIGWFFYLGAVSLLITVLAIKKIKNKLRIIALSTLILMSTALINLGHFYWLNGNIFNNLTDSLRIRSTLSSPFSLWLARMVDMARMNFSDFFLVLAILGLIVLIIQEIKTRKYTWFLAFIILPLLIFFLLPQWSGHPFAVIFLAPLIAVAIGVGLDFCRQKINYLTGEKFTSLIIILLILAGGLIASLKNIDFFFQKFVILRPADIELIKAAGQEASGDDYLCLGRNNFGISFKGIIQWNLKKNISISPDCLSASVSRAIIFHPRLGDFYAAEEQNFLALGLKNKFCSGWLCWLEK